MQMEGSIERWEGERRETERGRREEKEINVG